MPQSISQQKTTNAYHLQTSQRYRLYISLISKSYNWMLLIMRLKYGKDEHKKKKQQQQNKPTITSVESHPWPFTKAPTACPELEILSSHQPS